MGCGQSTEDPTLHSYTKEEYNHHGGNFTYQDATGKQRFTDPPNDQNLYQSNVLIQTSRSDKANSKNTEGVIEKRIPSPSNAGASKRKNSNKKPITIDRTVKQSSRAERNYDRNELGLFELSLDVRHAGEDFDWGERPSVSPGEQWEDIEFPLYLAIRDRNDIEWKRPGVSRNSIGDCKSGLQTIAFVSE